MLPREGLHLRLEVEEGTKRVVAIGLDYANSTLQVQPFAAPRTSGLWHEIRAQIADQIARQGGTTTVREGAFGPELLAQIPVAAAEGQAGHMRLARFIGVDGPRWFLRGVIAGEAAVDPDRRRAGRGPLPLHRRRARLDADASARPHPAAHARRVVRRAHRLAMTEPDAERRPVRDERADAAGPAAPASSDAVGPPPTAQPPARVQRMPRPTRHRIRASSRGSSPPPRRRAGSVPSHATSA